MSTTSERGHICKEGHALKASGPQEHSISHYPLHPLLSILLTTGSDFSRVFLWQSNLNNDFLKNPRSQNFCISFYLGFCCCVCFINNCVFLTIQKSPDITKFLKFFLNFSRCHSFSTSMPFSAPLLHSQKLLFSHIPHWKCAPYIVLRNKFVRFFKAHWLTEILSYFACCCTSFECFFHSLSSELVHLDRKAPRDLSRKITYIFDTS